MLTDNMKSFLLNRLETSEEGYRQFAYDDATGQRVKAPKGNMTIGIGWNLDSNGCPLELARIVTNYFITAIDHELSNKFVWFNSLDQVRQCVFIDMAFNMGDASLFNFKNTLNAAKEERYTDAAKGMRDSLWYRELPKRAEPLAHAMETGKFE